MVSVATNGSGRGISDGQQHRAGASAGPEGHYHGPTTFVSRVTSIPMVVEAYTTVNNAVHTLAERNRLARLALDNANCAVHSVVETASRYAGPYQRRFGPQISRADATANRVLDVVEEKFPIITQPSAQVFSNAKGAVTQVKTSVVSSKPVASASNVVKDLEAALASVMDNLERMVDKYLPEETTDNANGGEEVEANDGAHAHVHPTAPDGQVKRAVHLGVDVHRRLVRKVVGQIRYLQANVPHATNELLKLKESSHLINAATQSLRSLNEKLTPLVMYLQENASSLRDTGAERARALDAQFEIRERVEPVIRSYLTEISALTASVQTHLPAIRLPRPRPQSELRE